MLLLFCIFSQIRGEFYPVGPWPNQLPSMDNEGRLVLPQSDGFFRGTSKTLIPKLREVYISGDLVFAVVETNNRDRLHVFDQGIVIKEFPFSCRNIRPYGDMICVSLVHDKFLVALIDPKSLDVTMKFKSPNQNKAKNAWAIRRKEYTILAWNGDTRHLLATNRELDQVNNSKRPFQLGTYIQTSPWPIFIDATPSKISPAKYAPFHRRQDRLAKQEFVFFSAIGEGFLIARAIGVPAPNEPSVFIGCRTEIRMYQWNSNQIGSPYNTYGQCVDVQNDKLIILHNGQLTPSPLERWDPNQVGPAYIQGDILFRKAVQKELINFRPFYEKVPWPRRKNQ